MRFCIKIKGRVQGVYFRKFAQEKVVSLGLTGFVRNEPDGSVYTEAQGLADQLEMFADWCGEGSPMSKVTSIEVSMKNDEPSECFEIRK
ncbi:MAG: acylphosphatase [Flavobacteriales bacterium]|nr:acylphosphatase [Flavobacteriales bacterium]